ncbi:MAG: hypothetical protein ACXADB_04605 [Candidatus Hermodarchaeia archaeon]|jgi:hypothetical protein
MSKLQKVASNFRLKLADDKVMEAFLGMLRKWKNYNDLMKTPGLEMLADLSPTLSPIHNQTMLDQLEHLAKGGEDWEGIGEFYPGWTQEDFWRYIALLKAMPRDFDDLPEEYKALL